MKDTTRFPAAMAEVWSEVNNVPIRGSSLLLMNATKWQLLLMRTQLYGMSSYS